MRIMTGNDPKDYIEIIGKSMTYKRSRVSLSRKGREVHAVVDADDSRAMLASLQSLTKQLKVVESVGSLLKVNKV